MRPVNLIPPEERRGDRAPLRAGSLSYLVVALLGLALAGVCALVISGNAINDRKAEIEALEVREAAARVEAERLSGFAEFASLSEARAATVRSLARSRFDWERVLRELALLVPDDVWLIQLSGTATPEVQLENAAEVGNDAGASGPSLSMVGCATGHEAVARFLQALKDIDGVTRVGMSKSELPDDAGTSSSSKTDCRTRHFISRFEIVATFDGVAVPATDPATVPTPGAPPAQPTPATNEPGVAEAQAEPQQGVDSGAEQTGEARQAANLAPGVAR